MLDRSAVALALTAALITFVGSMAAAADGAKYPNWKGQWLPVYGSRGEGPSGPFYSTKPAGARPQGPPTPGEPKGPPGRHHRQTHGRGRPRPPPAARH